VVSRRIRISNDDVYWIILVTSILPELLSLLVPPCLADEASTSLDFRFNILVMTPKSLVTPLISFDAQ
jgi:hypothetical protein